MKAIIIAFAFFPLLQIVSILGTVYFYFQTQNPLWLVGFVIAVYIVPPLVWRIVNIVLPVKKGMSYIGNKAKTPNSWMISYHLQLLYSAAPHIENILKCVPGLYSLWLRLWGAKIGANVNWTPQCVIVDRPFVHIGARTLVGNQSYLSAHAIKKKEDRYILYLNDINIEEDVVIAVQALIGPGVEIKKRAFVSARAGVKPNTKINEGEVYEKFS